MDDLFRRMKQLHCTSRVQHLSIVRQKAYQHEIKSCYTYCNNYIPAAH